jgi:Lactonase, 7-bladed beta-propeller
MATSTGVSCPSLSIFQRKIQFDSTTLRTLLLLCVSLAFASAAHAQSSAQQYVYASASASPAPCVVPGFSKAAQTGALNLIPGSPFNERFGGGLVAIDGQGKFLFVLNPASNNISMFQINQATGALSEVPASPFQVPPTINPSLAPSQPISIATEKSGKFLFVGYYMGDIQGSSGLSHSPSTRRVSIPFCWPSTALKQTAAARPHSSSPIPKDFGSMSA